MVFTSAEFVVFICVTLALTALSRGLPRKLVLLTSSYVFYGSWNPKFAPLLAASTLVAYWLGLALATQENVRVRRAILIAGLGFDLGLLGVFKYFNFFVESTRSLLGLFGLHVDAPLLSVILPVGISFYTFQTMSYVIDVYRRSMEPCRSLLDFALYVSFFPQLVAGPIERAGNLLPQIRDMGRRKVQLQFTGLAMIAIGVVKKALIADNLAPIVDATYADPAATHGPALWIGTYAFATQIYCDFSGYSDIAVGLASFMGVRLMQNFRSPFAAVGPEEFFRRWHISLSTWFRDYVYIPLGGGRKGPLRSVFNVLVTFVLMALWHGAAWNFVLWGLYAAVVIALCRLGPMLWADRWLEGMRPLIRGPVTIVRRVIWFHLVCTCLSLFRSRSLEDCKIVFAKLWSFPTWDLAGWHAAVQQSGESVALAWAVAAVAGVLLAQTLWPGDSPQLVERLSRAPLSARVAIVSVALYLAAILNPDLAPPFVYFEF